MTERLYYNDPFLATFEANIIEVAEAGRRVYLDRTAFYPTSGGQPFDTGVIAGASVVDVVDEDDRIAHIVEPPLAPGPISAAIHWPRRIDHMQQHTGQHLLSATLHEMYGFPTLSFHLGKDACTIDIGAAALSAEQVARAEQQINQFIREDRAVTVSFEEAGQAEGLRKASERSGTLRIINIEGLDRSACGGTHVRSTGAIGFVQIRKLDKIRGNVRIEFLCGARAVDRARLDFNALNEIARAFSSPLDETPDLVKAQIERLKESDKVRRKLASEVAAFEGRCLSGETAVSPDGVRRVLRRVAQGTIDEEWKARAQGFTSAAAGVFLAAFGNPPALLLAVSPGAGNAGEIIKAAVSANGGRGGGNPQMAQGSLPSMEALEQALKDAAGRAGF